MTTVTGCGSPSQTAASRPISSPVYTSAYGVVDSIQVVPVSSGTSGLGTVAGGVVGGALGNQVGSGSGRTAATVAGAIGGAVVGNKMEKNAQGTREAYQIGIRLDDGNYQTIQQNTIAGLQIGSRVRVENGRVYQY